MSQDIHKGFYHHGYLPHIDDPEKKQFVTFRLADSLPNHVIERWKDELKTMSAEARGIEIRQRGEEFLDEGHGSCLLAQDEVAEVVKETLHRSDEYAYILFAYTIMPNHVHILIEQKKGHQLGQVVRTWKSRTSVICNRFLGRTGAFWQLDYFDRYIRDNQHFGSVLEYIAMNPVKGGLASHCEAWPHTWLRED